VLVERLARLAAGFTDDAPSRRFPDELSL